MIWFSKWKLLQEAGKLCDTSRLGLISYVDAKILQNRLSRAVMSLPYVDGQEGGGHSCQNALLLSTSLYLCFMYFCRDGQNYNSSTIHTAETKPEVPARCVQQVSHLDIWRYWTLFLLSRQTMKQFLYAKMLTLLTGKVREFNIKRLSKIVHKMQHTYLVHWPSSSLLSSCFHHPFLLDFWSEMDRKPWLNSRSGYIDIMTFWCWKLLHQIKYSLIKLQVSQGACRYKVSKECYLPDRPFIGFQKCGLEVSTALYMY